MTKRAKSWLDFLADLWSGRVHNTLAHLNTLITRLERRVAMNQQDLEQKLDEVATGIEGAASAITQGVGGLREQVNRLRTQAESPTRHQVDDQALADEFARIERALGTLREVGQGLTGATSPSGVSGTALPPEGATAPFTQNNPSRPGQGPNAAERLAASPGAQVEDADPTGTAGRDLGTDAQRVGKTGTGPGTTGVIPVGPGPEGGPAPSSTGVMVTDAPAGATAASGLTESVTPLDAGGEPEGGAYPSGNLREAAAADEPDGGAYPSGNLTDE
jgi:hypothetical protein